MFSFLSIFFFSLMLARVRVPSFPFFVFLLHQWINQQTVAMPLWTVACVRSFHSSPPFPNVPSFVHLSHLLVEQVDADDHSYIFILADVLCF